MLPTKAIPAPQATTANRPCIGWVVEPLHGGACERSVRGQGPLRLQASKFREHLADGHLSTLQGKRQKRAMACVRRARLVTLEERAKLNNLNNDLHLFSAKSGIKGNLGTSS